MKTLTKILMLVLGVVFLTSGVAFSQGESVIVEKAKEDLRLLQRHIERAREIVEESGNAEAEELFEKAVEHSGIAEQAIRNKEWKKALNHIHIAMDCALKAVKVVMDDLENVVKKGMIRLERLLERAEKVVTESESKEAKKILEEVKKFYDRVREAISQENYRLALRNIKIATGLALKAITIASGGIEEVFKKEMIGLEKLLERAKEMVSDSTNVGAKEVLEKALMFQDKARDAGEKERYRLALRYVHISTKLAFKAIEMAKGKENISERAKEELQRLQDLIEKAKNTIEESGDRKAEELFEDAIEYSKRAEDSIKDERYGEALKHIHIATDYVLRAVKATEK